MRALVVNWVADHWLIALVVWSLLLGWVAALWAQWVMGRCDRLCGDCERCRRICAAPFGSEDGDGFHLGAKLMPREEVERQLTAALEQRWEDDPEARKRLGEFKAALEEWHELTTDGADCTDGDRVTAPRSVALPKRVGRWL